VATAEGAQGDYTPPDGWIEAVEPRNEQDGAELGVFHAR